MSEEMQAVSPVVESQHTHVNFRFGPMLKVLKNNAEQMIIQHRVEYSDSRARIAHSLVSGDELYMMYLDSFHTPEARQEHTCACCKQFFRNYGNLVSLTPDGQTYSLLFDDCRSIPAEYREFTLAASTLLLGSKIEKMLYAADAKSPIELGRAELGGFDHFAYQLFMVTVRPDAYKTPWQNSAALSEDVRMLHTSLSKWNDDILTRAKLLFEHDADLQRTQFAEILPRFIDVRDRYRAIKHHKQRTNYLFAVATTVRKGLVRIGQSVVGEFLSNLGEGMSTELAKKMFLNMVDTKDYLRPKAAPAAQSVAQAEKIVGDLGLKEALRRRSLRRDELDGNTIWDQLTLESKGQETDAVFGAVVTKDQKAGVQKPTIDGGRLSLAALLDKIDDDVVRVEVDVPLIVWRYTTGDQRIRLTTKDAVVSYIVSSVK